VNGSVPNQPPTSEGRQRFGSYRPIVLALMGTPLINGAPFTNALTFTMHMALSAIDSIDSTKSYNNQNPV
jgi:hypothetical protein